MNADIAMIVVSCLRDFCFDVSSWAKIEIHNFEMWRNQHNSEIRKLIFVEIGKTQKFDN
jgi:hypothetical protein